MSVAPSDNAQPLAPPPRPRAPLGWWLVLIFAVLWIFDRNPNLGVPRNYYGTVWVIVRAGYAMIAARAAFGVLFRNRSWWWVVYAILLVMIEPLAVEIERTASDGWK